MALDTVAKRFSALQAYSPAALHLLIPDGSVSADDRATLCWIYGGIYGVSVTETVIGAMRITFLVKKPTVGWVELQPTVGWTVTKPTITFHEEG